MNASNDIHAQHGSRITEENKIYLLAKCCIDLELWKEAEDALLKTVPMDYVQYKKKHKVK